MVYSAQLKKQKETYLCFHHKEFKYPHIQSSFIVFNKAFNAITSKIGNLQHTSEGFK